jgi:hypothetical protein
VKCPTAQIAPDGSVPAESPPFSTIYYYHCHHHDPLRAGGQDRRCPERNIRADALDDFVFAQIRAALPDPALLLAGEQAAAVTAPAPDDELLAAELARLDRKLDAARAEHTRLIDLFQAALFDMPEPQRRAAAITTRQKELTAKRGSLAAQRADLAKGNQLRRGVEHFAARVRTIIDDLDPDQKQQLLRLLIDNVQVTGWHIKIQLRIPLPDPPPEHCPRRDKPTPDIGPATVSSEDSLRSLHEHRRRQLPDAVPPRPGRSHPPRRGQHMTATQPGPPSRHDAVTTPGLPSCHDGVTTPCPVCEHPFTPAGRRKFCSGACRALAYRRRPGSRRHPRRPPQKAGHGIRMRQLRQPGPREPVLRPGGTFMRRAGTGGCCPSCGEPVTIAELSGPKDRT